MFIVMLPRATRGNNSVSISWIVSSLVNQVGNTFDIAKKADVTINASVDARNMDLYEDRRARAGLPFPNWYETRTSPASPMASVVDSKTSHTKPKTAHVAYI